MSTLVVAQPALDGLGPGLTLDDVVVDAWTRLSADQAVECPVCHGEMEPEQGSQATPVRGRCTDCGTVLR